MPLLAPPGSDELAEVTSEAIGDDKAVLMGNHGAICIDETIDKAYNDAIVLEREREGGISVLSDGKCQYAGRSDV